MKRLNGTKKGRDTMTMAEIIERFICIPSTVAVVGASPKEDRSVFSIMSYLHEAGFHLHPINPGYAGESIQGHPCLASLDDLPEPVDVVALFISAEHQEGVVQSLRRLPYKPIVWFQPGSENADQERALVAAGYPVAVNSCMMMIHQVYCH